MQRCSIIPSLAKNFVLEHTQQWNFYAQQTGCLSQELELKSHNKRSLSEHGGGGDMLRKNIVSDWWGQKLHQRPPSLFAGFKFRSLTAIIWRIMWSLFTRPMKQCLLVNVAKLLRQTLHINLSVGLTASSHTARCNGLKIWLRDRSQRLHFDQISFFRHSRSKRQEESRVTLSLQQIYFFFFLNLSWCAKYYWSKTLYKNRFLHGPFYLLTCSVLRHVLLLGNKAAHTTF